MRNGVAFLGEPFSHGSLRKESSVSKLSEEVHLKSKKKVTVKVKVLVYF